MPSPNEKIARLPGESHVEKVQRLQAEIAAEVEHVSASIRAQLESVRAGCIEAQDMPLPVGEIEEYRHLAEDIGAMLQRIARLRGGG